MEKVNCNHPAVNQAEMSVYNVFIKAFLLLQHHIWETGATAVELKTYFPLMTGWETQPGSFLFAAAKQICMQRLHGAETTEDGPGMAITAHRPSGAQPQGSAFRQTSHKVTYRCSGRAGSEGRALPGWAAQGTIVGHCEGIEQQIVWPSQSCLVKKPLGVFQCGFTPCPTPPPYSDWGAV